MSRPEPSPRTKYPWVYQFPNEPKRPTRITPETWMTRTMTVEEHDREAKSISVALDAKRKLTKSLGL